MAKNHSGRPKLVTKELTRVNEDLRKLYDEASSSRKRDSLSPYLAAVLKKYQYFTEWGLAKKATKKMCVIRGVKKPPKDSITRIIIATSTTDAKAASKMTRALRYIHYNDWTDVAAKLKRNGGIAGCAEKFSELLE